MFDWISLWVEIIAYFCPLFVTPNQNLLLGAVQRIGSHILCGCRIAQSIVVIAGIQGWLIDRSTFKEIESVLARNALNKHFVSLLSLDRGLVTVVRIPGCQSLNLSARLSLLCPIFDLSCDCSYALLNAYGPSFLLQMRMLVNWGLCRCKDWILVHVLSNARSSCPSNFNQICRLLVVVPLHLCHSSWIQIFSILVVVRRHLLFLLLQSTCCV